MTTDPGRKDGPFAAGREKDAVAASQGGRAKDTEFLRDVHGVPILDAAALEVLKAWRYFMQGGGDPPAIVAALLVVAWAIMGKLS